MRSRVDQNSSVLFLMTFKTLTVLGSLKKALGLFSCVTYAYFMFSLVDEPCGCVFMRVRVKQEL